MVEVEARHSCNCSPRHHIRRGFRPCSRCCLLSSHAQIDCTSELQANSLGCPRVGKIEVERGATPCSQMKIRRHKLSFRPTRIGQMLLIDYVQDTSSPEVQLGVDVPDDFSVVANSLVKRMLQVRALATMFEY